MPRRSSTRAAAALVLGDSAGCTGGARRPLLTLRALRAALTDSMYIRTARVPVLGAVLTQVATPVGNAFVTAAIAPFGDNAVAGWAVIVRLIPVAFVALFALSGSVGPILGQNLGARRFDRLRSTVRDSLKVTLVYVLVVWLLMALGSGFIATAFGAQGEARELIVFFCVFVAGSFFFNGALRGEVRRSGERSPTGCQAEHGCLARTD